MATAQRRDRRLIVFPEGIVGGLPKLQTPAKTSFEDGGRNVILSAASLWHDRII
jgi:hypothetical protein